MKIRDATAKAFQILDEERRYPTVQYSPIPVASAPKLDPAAAAISELRQIMKETRAENALSKNRSELPRTVLVGSHRFEFRSQNYNLLVTLFGRVDETDRSAFLKAITKRLGIFPACLKNAAAPLPSWNSHTSELPLVAEFIIRNGGRQAFFEALEKCQPSPGVAVMLLQLADVVALNYPIFSESEYALLSHAVSCLRSTAYDTYIHIQTYGYTLGAEKWSNHGFNGSAASLDILKLCDAVTELCRKATFLQLQDALVEDINLEVNQDKYVVQGFLEKFGFSAPLIRALNEAEKLNSVGATELELKSSLGHLRSFLENLHAEAIPQIQEKKKLAPPADQKWGTQLAYLRVNDFLSKQEEQFVAGLYAVISDEAVHPLIAKREYARLARNVIIEYALLFLRKLEQLGVMRSLASSVP
jgi:hypothetical protein